MNCNCCPQPDRDREKTQMRNAGGFTLIELGMVIAIIGILAALAVPSFSSLIASQRAKAVATDLYVSLSRARSEAITRNTNVTLKQKPGGWASGWQIPDPADVTQTQMLDDRGAASNVTITNPTTSVVYRPSGRVEGPLPSFDISTVVGSTTNHQCISVELNGRPYKKASASTC